MCTLNALIRVVVDWDGCCQWNTQNFDWCLLWGPDSPVGVVTWILAGRSGVRLAAKRFITSPKRPDLLWGITNLLLNVRRGLLPRC